jgi:hypothetical protein
MSICCLLRRIRRNTRLGIQKGKLSLRVHKVDNRKLVASNKPVPTSVRRARRQPDDRTGPVTVALLKAVTA